MSRPSDELAAEVDHVPCPTCGAEAGQLCTNPIKQSLARVPCIQRIRVAATDVGPTETPSRNDQETTDR